ncbi:MAG TPA: hypothetical protein VHN36_03690, partial [Ilumatobacteraceae bacterium]|nr:hypothetical protein [Ilumatobacteraceae bacterium]
MNANPTVPTTAAGGAVLAGATDAGAIVTDDDDSDDETAVCTGRVVGDDVACVVVGLAVVLPDDPQATITTVRHAAVAHVPTAATFISRPLT